MVCFFRKQDEAPTNQMKNRPTPWLLNERLIKNRTLVAAGIAEAMNVDQSVSECEWDSKDMGNMRRLVSSYSHVCMSESSARLIG